MKRRRERSAYELAAFGFVRDPDDEPAPEQAETSTADVEPDDSDGALADTEPAAPVDAPPPESVHKRKPPRAVRKSNSRVATELDVPKPKAHWNLSGESPEELASVHVWEVGCFYVRFEGGERYRCYNKLNGFEHVSYGTREEVEENLERQSKIWQDKLSGVTVNVTPWRRLTPHPNPKAV